MQCTYVSFLVVDRRRRKSNGVKDSRVRKQRGKVLQRKAQLKGASKRNGICKAEPRISNNSLSKYIHIKMSANDKRKKQDKLKHHGRRLRVHKSVTSLTCSRKTAQQPPPVSKLCTQV